MNARVVADSKGAEDEAFADLNRFTELVAKQDDRAMILSMAAFIEEALGRLLVAYFRDCKATRELVEGFNAPLGTLSARIKAAYSFGLVSEEQYRDMEILRKVRNAFAHDWEGVSVERNDLAALLGQLSCYSFDGVAPCSTARERLTRTIGCLASELQIFVSRLGSRKMNKAPDVSFRLTTKPPKPGYSSRFV